MVRDKAEYILIACFGLFCMWQAFQIEISKDSVVSARLVPIGIAGMIVVLGVLQIIVALVTGRTKNVKGYDSILPQKNSESSAALHTPSVLRIIVIPVVGFVYIWLISSVGYLIATTIIIAFVLFLFGTRNPGKIAIISIGTGALYYFIFIYLIGIYAPPGWLLNLQMLGF